MKPQDVIYVYFPFFHILRDTYYYKKHLILFSHTIAQKMYGQPVSTTFPWYRNKPIIQSYCTKFIIYSTVNYSHLLFALGLYPRWTCNKHIEHKRLKNKYEILLECKLGTKKRDKDDEREREILEMETEYKGWDYHIEMWQICQ